MFDKNMIIASGLPRRTAYQFRERHGSFEGIARFAFDLRTGQSRRRAADGAQLRGMRSIPWIKATRDLVYLHATTGESLKSLARYFGVSEEEATRIVTRASEIATFRYPDGRSRHPSGNYAYPESRPTSGVLVPCPELLSEERMADVYSGASVFERLCAPHPSSQARAALDYYARNVEPHTVRVGFADCKSAQPVQQYLDFLSHIRIRRKRLRIILWGVRARSPEYREWRKILGQTNPVELFEFDDERSEIAPLTIEPTFDPRRGPCTCAEVFRYLMVMSAVRFS